MPPPNDRTPPRAGVNDEESFLGSPPGRPAGLDPFSGQGGDASIEGEVALEVLPKMARATSSYDVKLKRSYLPMFLAAIVAGALGAALYFIVR